MRSESRNQGLVFFMALTLVLIIIVGQFRLGAAAGQVTAVNPRSPFTVTVKGDTPITVSGTYGSISTRDGEVVFDGMDTKYPALYSVVGNVTGETHLSTYTLAARYAEELRPGTLNVMSGLHHYKAESGVSMTTTLLPGSAQQTLYEAFDEYHGAVFAYNYVTGEVYCMLSVPSGQTGTEDDGHLTNRVRSVYTPGSTMKIVTLVCALTQNPALKDYTYTCTGSHEVPNGPPVTCGYVHYGPLTMSDAIGHSCNCYFASLIEQLDVNETCDILESLGLNTYGKYKGGTIDRVTYTKGIAEFINSTSNQHIWKLIGQGSEVSLVDMARMAGAIANGGSCATPYLVENIYDPNKDVYTLTFAEAKMEELVSPETAALLSPMWRDAVTNYYSTKLDSRITMAKTGTAEYEDSKTKEEHHNRLLLGIIEEYNTAFMLVVEYLPAGNAKIVDIANTLVDVLEASGIGQ